ncbi:uncharacterized protein [Nicotiana sylvestris]|uniref:uncharacterized protein n=1 Tax=Nicotiana sylvestris TaxID=4096 RepID=UPI00388C68FA
MSINYDTYSYGKLFSVCTQEGLALCNEIKLNQQIKKHRLTERQQLGEFCEQFASVKEGDTCIPESFVLVKDIDREYCPYQKIDEREVVKFLWENIIYKFGIPKEIACDNGPQFIGAKFTKFLEDLKIKWITSSPYYLSANDQAELTNKVIIQNLKKRLEADKGKWPKELHGANEEANNEAMLVNLELIDERMDLAHIRMAAQKQRIERYYNRKANLRYFKVGYLVLRKVAQNTRELNAGKFGPTWEGPYRVSAVIGKGSYELEIQDGEKLPNNQNMAHLKRYYS